MDPGEIKNGWQAMVTIIPWILTFLTALAGAYFAFQIKVTVLGQAKGFAARNEATNAKIEELHVAVNSRLTALLETTAKLAKAQGIAEGITKGRGDDSAQQKPPASDKLTGG